MRLLAVCRVFRKLLLARTKIFMATSPKPAKLKRVTNVDFSEAEEIFKVAAYLTVPEDQTQHQAFLKLMPHLYVLRNKGCSFVQLTTLLTKCNFNLQPSTVKDYYNNALANQMDICQERMNEQILLLAEVRKATRGAEVSSMFERVTEMLEKQRSASAAKIDHLFGASGATPVARTALAGLNEAAKPLLVGNKNLGLRPYSSTPPPADSDASGFGLLNLKPVAKKSAPKTLAFFSQDDSAPVIPELTISTLTSKNKNSGLRPAPEIPATDSTSPDKTSPSTGLRCLPLEDGPPQLKKRPNVPPEIYQPGDFEHPKIPGLLLSLEARIYGAALEYADKNGEVQLETMDEKQFRVLWKRPVAMTKTMTGDSFTKIDYSAFTKQ